MACLTSPNLGSKRTPLRLNLYWYWTTFLIGGTYERFHGVRWITLHFGFLGVQIEYGRESLIE